MQRGCINKGGCINCVFGAGTCQGIQNVRCEEASISGCQNSIQGCSHKIFGVWDFGWVCIEFAPIFIQFRFFNGKKFVWGFEPVSPLPKHTHDSIIISI